MIYLEIQFENKDICQKCGGMCCKKSGCDYIPSDFKKISYDYLYEVLGQGKISIVSALSFEELPNGKIVANPFLYLRARNINRPIVDLFSMKTSCSQLGKNGCNYSLEERPSGGVNLIPKENNKCYHLKSHRELIELWQNYQKILTRLVKRINHLTVDEQLKLDIENVFYDLLMNNVEGVSKQELYEIKEGIILLKQAFPEQLINALHRCKRDNYSKLKR